MSVGPDGRLLSIGTEEDLFAYGWEWKAVIWLRGHQLMHPEQPHVHRASFNYATFSVTLNFAFVLFFSSSLSNLDKSGGLWRLWLFSCLWERAESLSPHAHPFKMRSLVKKVKPSLPVFLGGFLNTRLLLLFSTHFLCTWKMSLFHIFVSMGRAKYVNGQSTPILYKCVFFWSCVNIQGLITVLTYVLRPWCSSITAQRIFFGSVTSGKLFVRHKNVSCV